MSLRLQADSTQRDYVNRFSPFSRVNLDAIFFLERSNLESRGGVRTNEGEETTPHPALSTVASDRSSAPAGRSYIPSFSRSATTPKRTARPLIRKNSEAHFLTCHQFCLSYGHHKIIAAPNANTPTKAPTAIPISMLPSWVDGGFTYVAGLYYSSGYHGVKGAGPT